MTRFDSPGNNPENKTDVVTNSVANYVKIKSNIDPSNQNENGAKNVINSVTDGIETSSNDDLNSDIITKLLKEFLTKTYRENEIIQEIMKVKSENFRKLPNKCHGIT